VTGTVGLDGLTNDTADSKTLCLTANNEVVSNSGSTCITSSRRFKNSISSLDDASGLAEILKLNPVSFHYNDNVGIPGEQVGFIAEQVQQVDPRLVILDASGTPFTVRYEQLTSLLAKAIQQIATITGTFKDALIAWLGSATNGLARVHTHELCTTKSDGTEVCASGDQLAALLAGAGAGAPNAGSSGGAPAGEPTQGDASVDTGGSTTTDTNFLTFNGNNPAEWQLNQPWQDNLGALFTHDGQSETTYSTSTADTTQPGTTANAGTDGFKDRDLYVFCFNVADGKVVATQAANRIGMDVRTNKDAKGNAFGAEIYKAAQDGKFNEVSYMFPKPGATEPSPKVSFVTKVGDLGCGVGYYK
jgi:endosialidase-like protein/single cache domain-containing protein